MFETGQLYYYYNIDFTFQRVAVGWPRAALMLTGARLRAVNTEIH
jgi:hypothetical protein